jgi:hypothetical protein
MATWYEDDNSNAIIQSFAAELDLHSVSGILHQIPAPVLPSPIPGLSTAKRCSAKREDFIKFLRENNAKSIVDKYMLEEIQHDIDGRSLSSTSNLDVIDEFKEKYYDEIFWNKWGTRLLILSYFLFAKFDDLELKILTDDVLMITSPQAQSTVFIFPVKKQTSFGSVNDVPDIFKPYINKLKEEDFKMMMIQPPGSNVPVFSNRWAYGFNIENEELDMIWISKNRDEFNECHVTVNEPILIKFIDKPIPCFN